MNKDFKVVHAIYSASAQTLGFRLHHEFVKQNVSSTMFTGSKSINFQNLIQPVSIAEKISAMTGIVREMLYKKIIGHDNKPYFSFNIGPLLFQKKWLNKLNSNKFDLIHLHWIANGFIPLKELGKIKKPVVWTLYDVWAFTGGCHVNRGCENFTSGCKICPQLQKTRARFLSDYLFKKKMKSYLNLNMHIVAISNWMAEQARSSVLLSGFTINVIPPGLDTEVFKPLDKIFSREVLGLPSRKKVIAFGAISATTDNNKGFDLLKAAIDIVVKKNKNIVLLVFGAENSYQLPFNFDCEVKIISRLSDEISLSLLYSAADVVVVPSRQEAFSQVSSESLSCGTPVVAFNSTGPKDIIDHKINGYMAEPYDTDDLARGIEWVISPKTDYKRLSKNARKKVLETFSIPAVADKYMALYRRILSGK